MITCADKFERNGFQKI